jgi:hypothetical protein
VRGQSLADHVLIGAAPDNLSREQGNRVQTTQCRASEMRTSPSTERWCNDRVDNATRFLGVVHVVHWRSGAPVHHTVHRKVRTYQIAITRYFDLVALHPFF